MSTALEAAERRIAEINRLMARLNAEIPARIEHLRAEAAKGRWYDDLGDLQRDLAELVARVAGEEGS